MSDPSPGDEPTHSAITAELVSHPTSRPVPRRRSAAGSFVGAVRETVLVIAVALIVSLVVKTFLLQAFFIPSASMENTLLKGDRVIVSKLTPGPFDLHRGDVVVFADPGHWLPPATPAQHTRLGGLAMRVLTFVGLLPQDSDDHLIKRVIGLPGDHVVFTDPVGPLSVNGTAVQESGYLKPGARPCGKTFDVAVPVDRLWVMGDNRDDSEDSRYHPDAPYGGFVPLELVTGRAYTVVWPLGRWAWLGTPGDFDDVSGPAGVS